MTVVASFTVRVGGPPKRVPVNVRLAKAARVLGRFDLQMLMLAAQVSKLSLARTFINAGLQAGSLAGPPLGMRRKFDGLEWTFIPASARPQETN